MPLPSSPSVASVSAATVHPVGRRTLRLALALSVAAGSLPSAAQARTRLPAPHLMTTQLASGCVRLSWEAIPGAASYNLGRSAGRNGFQRVPDAPAGPDTVYLDGQVKAKERVSYTVTPVDAQGVAGFRATSEPFTPTQSAGKSCLDDPAPKVRMVEARLSSTGFDVRWQVAHGVSARQIEVRHLVDGELVNSVRASARDASGMQFDNATRGQHRFDVVLTEATGYVNPPVSSNVVTVGTDPRSGGGSGPGGGSAPVAASSASTELSFAVGGVVTLRVGASAALGAGGGQWSTLDAGIASVTADGTVTARAPGEARMVGVSAAGSGGVRVTVVRVTVTP